MSTYSERCKAQSRHLYLRYAQASGQTPFKVFKARFETTINNGAQHQANTDKLKNKQLNCFPRGNVFFRLF